MLEMLVCSISTPLHSDAIASLTGQLSHKYFSPVNPHSSWTLFFFFYFFNSHMEADIKIKYSLYSAFYYLIQTKVRVKAAARGQAVFLVHAQVPLAHHVRVVARLLQQLRQQFLIQRDAIRLARPDDLVLHARVDLRG